MEWMDEQWNFLSHNAPFSFFPIITHWKVELPPAFIPTEGPDGQHF
jgi:hypothetical protein